MNNLSWTILWCFCIYAAFGMAFGYSYQRRKGGSFMSGFLAGILGPIGWIALALSVGNLKTPEEKAAAREKAGKNVQKAILILFSLGLVLFVGLIIASEQPSIGSDLSPTSRFSNLADPPTPTVPFAQAYATARPAAPLAVATSTSDCLDWKLVNLSNVGSRLCVTGIVYSASDDGVAWYVKFKSDYTSFYFVSYAWNYPEVQAGSFVKGRGIVKRIGNAPVIVLDEGQKGDFQIRR